MKSSTEKKLGIILQYLQMGLNILISLLYTPIMLRILGQAQYGIYNLSNSIISYLSLLSLGFGASYIRFYSRYKSKKDLKGICKLNGLYLIVFLLMAIVALFCGLGLSTNVSLFYNASYSEEDIHIAKILMTFMSVNLSISFIDSVFSAYVTAQEKFVFQKLLNMVKTIVSPLLTLPLLLLGYGSVGMVFVTTVVTIFADIINILFCVNRLEMKFDFHELDKHLLKEIATFSSFIALNQIVDQINWATDKIVLGKVCSSTVVAVYAVGSQINNYYMSFSTAISGVFAPQVNWIVVSKKSETDKNRELTELLAKVGRIQFIVLALILSGFIFFGKFFVLWWAGDGYERSYYVALLLIVPVTIPLIQNIGIEIQRAKNMHQFRSIIYLFMALFNIAISIVFAKLWGEIGAAFGTALSLLLANGLIMNIFYHKKMKMNMFFFWKEVLKLVPSLIPSSIFGIVISLKECRTVVEFVIRVVVYTIVYVVSMYLFGMNAFEKNIVIDISHKLGIKK